MTDCIFRLSYTSTSVLTPSGARLAPEGGPSIGVEALYLP